MLRGRRRLKLLHLAVLPLTLRLTVLVVLLLLLLSVLLLLLLLAVQLLLEGVRWPRGRDLALLPPLLRALITSLLRLYLRPS